MEAEIEKAGRLPGAAVLACKSRYFVDGAVLGSKLWVDRVITDLKGDYLTKQRKMGGSRPRDQLRGSGLWSLRQLQLE